MQQRKNLRCILKKKFEQELKINRVLFNCEFRTCSDLQQNYNKNKLELPGRLFLNVLMISLMRVLLHIHYLVCVRCAMLFLMRTFTLPVINMRVEVLQGSDLSTMNSTRICGIFAEKQNLLSEVYTSFW